MSDRPSLRLTTRKQPRQARSTELVAAILEAAVQVLETEGAQRFTTARVAARAGVSVGSLYQYFPNKAAILFRLQSDEWRQTADLLGRILLDRSTPPFDRVRRLVLTFLRSECEEAAIRTALDDAAPLYRASSEARAAKDSVHRIVDVFMGEVLPEVSPARRALSGDLIITTLGTVGQAFSGKARTPAEIEAYAEAMADMFCAYLKGLA